MVKRALLLMALAACGPTIGDPCTVRQDCLGYTCAASDLTRTAHAGFLYIAIAAHVLWDVWVGYAAYRRIPPPRSDVVPTVP
jgi:hypothetical protein